MILAYFSIKNQLKLWIEVSKTVKKLTKIFKIIRFIIFFAPLINVYCILNILRPCIPETKIVIHFKARNQFLDSLIQFFKRKWWFVTKSKVFYFNIHVEYDPIKVLILKWNDFCFFFDQIIYIKCNTVINLQNNL